MTDFEEERIELSYDDWVKEADQYPKIPSEKDLQRADAYERIADELDKIGGNANTYVSGCYRSWARSLRDGTQPVAFA